MIREIADAALKTLLYIGYITLIFGCMIGFLYLIPIMLSVFI